MDSDERPHGAGDDGDKLHKEMKNTPYIGLYNKVVEIRLKDRRVIIGKTQDKRGFRIEATKVDRGRYWKAAKTERIHNAKVITTIIFSKEAMIGIMQAVNELETNPRYK